MLMVMFLNSPSIIYGMIHHHVYCRRFLYNVQLLPFSSGIEKTESREQKHETNNFIDINKHSMYTCIFNSEAQIVCLISTKILQNSNAMDR